MRPDPDAPLRQAGKLDARAKNGSEDEKRVGGGRPSTPPRRRPRWPYTKTNAEHVDAVINANACEMFAVLISERVEPLVPPRGGVRVRRTLTLVCGTIFSG